MFAPIKTKKLTKPINYINLFVRGESLDRVVCPPALLGVQNYFETAVLGPKPETKLSSFLILRW